MSLGIIYSDGLNQYDFGPGHPFRGDRYTLFMKFLKEHLAEGNNYQLLSAQIASDEDLLCICTKEYINATREFYEAAYSGLVFPGTFLRYHSGDNIPLQKPGRIEEAARLVIGQAKTACQLVQTGKYEKVVSVGGGLHHAKPSYGEGFCLYNDVAFCGMYLLKEYSLERILILDTDAHAGNGTCEYFYEEPRVLFIDVHQDPRTLYPGTGFIHQVGKNAGEGYTINIPMPVYSAYDSYELVFEQIVEPLVATFKPQVIIRNGGSDPHFSDSLTNLNLPLKGFSMIGNKVKEMAKICNGKVIDLIASGYNKEILPYAWLSLVSALAGIELNLSEPVEPYHQYRTIDSLEETKYMIDEARKTFNYYWKCF